MIACRFCISICLYYVLIFDMWRYLQKSIYKAIVVAAMLNFWDENFAWVHRAPNIISYLFWRL